MVTDSQGFVQTVPNITVAHNDVSAVNELTRLTQMLTDIANMYFLIMIKLVNVNSIKFSLV